MDESTNRSDMASGMPVSDRLDSWKEIAAYLRRNERTARRWEKTEGLPVYRHAHAKRDSVYAYKKQLDAWRNSRRFGLEREQSAAIVGNNVAWRTRFRWIGAIAGIMAIAALATWHISRTGVQDPIKAIPLTSYPGYERYSSFSPDGSHVAFSWNGETLDNYDIYVKLIGSSVPIRRTTHPADDLSPAWSPDGRSIAFLRLFPGDKTKADVILIPVSGGPENRLAVISRMDSAPSSLILFGHDLAWSPDSKFLVVPDRDSREGPVGLFLVSVETGAKRKLLYPPAKSGSYLAPSLSPSGRYLAFVRRTDFVVSEIYLSTLQPDFTPEGEPKRITYENRLTTSPVWAVDGREIMFLSGELGADAALYSVSISGVGKPNVLPFLREGAALLALARPAGGPFPPGPRRLAYTRAIKDHNIWRTDAYRADGRFSTPRPFISSTRIDFNPQLSPDGTRIAFESSRSGSTEIWVANSDGSNPMQVTYVGGPLTSAARWCPDGQRIIFNSRAGGQSDIYVVSANGGKPRRLTDEPSMEDMPSLSRDGHWFYFQSNRSGSSQIWKMPVQGGELIQVTKKGGLACSGVTRR